MEPNLGHEQVMTTFRSYGFVPQRRQAELIWKLGQPKVSAPNSAINFRTCLLQALEDAPAGCCHWRLRAGAANKAGLRNVYLVRPKAAIPAPKLPRYVQTRKLADGTIAYYWCRPWWARGEDCPLCNEALGVHLDKLRAGWRAERPARRLAHRPQILRALRARLDKITGTLSHRAPGC